jgi:hypothetical protein
MLCDPDSDPEGTELRNGWVKPDHVELDDDTDPRFVTRQSIAMLERVVLALHRDGVWCSACSGGRRERPTSP